MVVFIIMRKRLPVKLLSFSVPSFTEISAKLHIAQPENESRVPVLNIYSSSDCQYEVRNIS